jgi:hypothetical protein
LSGGAEEPRAGGQSELLAEKLPRNAYPGLAMQPLRINRGRRLGRMFFKNPNATYSKQREARYATGAA